MQENDEASITSKGSIRGIRWAIHCSNYETLLNVCNLEIEDGSECSDEVYLNMYVDNIAELISGKSVSVVDKKELWYVMKPYLELGIFKPDRYFPKSFYVALDGFIAGCKLVLLSMDDENGDAARIVKSIRDSYPESIDQEEKIRVRLNLESYSTLTKTSMKCNECGYEGKLGLLGKVGFIFKKKNLKCPSCEIELLGV